MLASPGHRRPLLLPRALAFLRSCRSFSGPPCSELAVVTTSQCRGVNSAAHGTLESFACPEGDRRGTAGPELASFQSPFPTILWPGSSSHGALFPSPLCCPLHVDLRNSGEQVSDMAETQGCSFHGDVDRTHWLPFIRLLQ